MIQLAAAFCLLIASVAAAAADGRMSAAEFEAYVTGKTLYYSSQGTAYGVEQYLTDRRVIWTFLEDECQEGVWYEEDDLICFVYDYDPEPQCWSFWKKGSGLAARFENDPAATELYGVTESGEGLRCPGPDIGA